jgi:tRNA pseudouridine38-40 synthase
MRNIRLVLEYDGTRYAGWQRQENALTVQEEVERTLGRVLGAPPSIIGAGRTDAGVHARGQVANFRTEHAIATEELRGALNALLPEDIVVHGVDEVPLEFHSRYSARSRSYSYTITLRPTALARATSWHVRYDLDPARMNAAAATILGTHEFESFCRANSGVDHHRCTVRTARWDEIGTTLRFSVTADRFLHGMVRALVGTMVDVGRGFTSLARFEEILRRRDRQEAGMSAPACGLVLESVGYDSVENAEIGGFSGRG